MKLFYFIKSEFKFQFQSSLVIWGYLLGILLNLVVYYYTSKAFVPKAELLNQYLSKGYFEFIIIGELCLMIPQVAISEGQETFFRFRESGLLGQLHFSKSGLGKSLFYSYFSICFLKFVFVILNIVLGILFFKLDFTFQMLFAFLLLQILSTLLFVGVYFSNLIFSFIVGRRNKSLQHIVNLLCFFSGAYFPLNVFDSELIKKILSMSPFALHVSISRSFIYDGFNVNSGDFFIYIIWISIPAIFSFLFFTSVKNKYIGRFIS